MEHMLVFCQPLSLLVPLPPSPPLALVPFFMRKNSSQPLFRRHFGVVFLIVVYLQWIFWGFREYMTEHCHFFVVWLHQRTSQICAWPCRNSSSQNQTLHFEVGAGMSIGLEWEISINSQTDHTLQFARRPQTSCGDKDSNQISPCRPLLAQMERREKRKGENHPAAVQHWNEVT